MCAFVFGDAWQYFPPTVLLPSNLLLIVIHLSSSLSFTSALHLFSHVTPLHLPCGGFFYCCLPILQLRILRPREVAQGHTEAESGFEPGFLIEFFPCSKPVSCHLFLARGPEKNELGVRDITMGGGVGRRASFLGGLYSEAFPDGRLWLLASVSWIFLSTVTFISTLIPVFGFLRGFSLLTDDSHSGVSSQFKPSCWGRMIT